jgi:hypothetical protein
LISAFTPRGASSVDSIVGIRPWDDRSLRIYRRTGRTVVAESVPFQPWLALADPSLLERESAGTASSLTGEGELRTLIRFERWPQAWDAIQKILSLESERRRQRISSYLELPGLLFLPDPAEQWLTASGESFFSGLSAENLVRLQLAIETASPPGRPSRPDRSQDCILAIAATISDGRKSTFRIRKQDEAALLGEFLEWFTTIDPDVVEGIELLGFTLPYIAERCALHGIDPSFGREATSLRTTATPIGKGPWELPGRIALEPVEALRHAGPTIQAIVTETRAVQRTAPVSNLAKRCFDARRWADRWWSAMLPLMSAVPLPPDRFLRTGPGHWLEAWLMRECLRRGASIPSSGPHISAQQEVVPSGTSGWYAPAAELVLVPSKAAAWQRLGEAATGSQPEWVRELRDQWEPVFKSPATGSDRTIAIALLTGLTDAVRARTSRLHVSNIAERLDYAIADTAAEVATILRRHNVEVIQEVGDRLYVQYPDNVTDDDRRALFWNKVNEALPSGLRAVPLRTFEALVSLAPRIMHGLSRQAVVQLPRPHTYRSPEAFIREYHARAIVLVLRRQWNLLHQLTAETTRRIKARAWHVSEFCRRETLAGSLGDYVRDRGAHRRNPSAPYEALLRAQPPQNPSDEATPPRRQSHEAGSTVVYYIAGNRRDLPMADMSCLAEFWDPSAPDENTEYYLDRLRQSLERYRPLVSERDFSLIFGEEGLFSFKDDEIELLRHSFGSSERGDPTAGPDKGIWLDIPPKPT